MPKLILLRHGQSAWNAADLFAGWIDVPLSETGIDEALAAGRALADEPIDIVYTSTLIRAQMTAMIALVARGGEQLPVIMRRDEPEELGFDHAVHNETTESNILPVHSDWRLNERNYGVLQGLGKQATKDKHGLEQVHIWRRSYDVPPPGGESLEMCAGRTLPCFQEAILPHLKAGLSVFVAAHGNSLRSIVMSIEGMSKQEVLFLEIATAVPLIYDYAESAFTRVA